MATQTSTTHKSNSKSNKVRTPTERKAKPGTNVAPQEEAPSTTEPEVPETSEAEESEEAAPAETTAATTAAERYQARMAKLPVARRIEVKTKNAKERFGLISALMKDWPEEYQEAKEAGSALAASFDAFLAAVAKVPDTFKPKGISKATAAGTLAAGAKVWLRPKHAPGYEGIIEASAELTVVLVTPKGKVVCTTAEGDRVALPRGHVITKKPEPAPEPTEG